MEITVKELLRKEITDEVIIFQTDTVYGIGCLMESQLGVEKIYQIKGREQDKPLVILCANWGDIEALTQEAELLKPLAKKYWPGALTCIVKKSQRVPDFVSRGFDTVGLRIPDDALALEILSHYGPMAVTSLNYSNEPPILNYKDALLFEDKVDYIVKGPNLDNIVSTVFDVKNRKILRPGNINPLED